MVLSVLYDGFAGVVPWSLTQSNWGAVSEDQFQVSEHCWMVDLNDAQWYEILGSPMSTKRGWCARHHFYHCTIDLYKNCYFKAHSHERLNHHDSVAGRLAWIASDWAISDCVFKHLATVNQKRVCSSLRERQQNNEILQNSSNYFFRRVIQSLQLTTGCQILNMFKVNHWLLRLCNSDAVTGNCSFTWATVSLAFLQRWNRGDSVAYVNGSLYTSMVQQQKWSIVQHPPFVLIELSKISYYCASFKSTMRQYSFTCY